MSAAGTKPKRIEEYAGRVNPGHAQVSKEIGDGATEMMVSWIRPSNSPTSAGKGDQFVFDCVFNNSANGTTVPWIGTTRSTFKFSLRTFSSRFAAYG